MIVALMTLLVFGASAEATTIIGPTATVGECVALELEHFLSDTSLDGIKATVTQSPSWRSGRWEFQGKLGQETLTIKTLGIFKVETVTRSVRKADGSVEQRKDVVQCTVREPDEYSDKSELLSAFDANGDLVLSIRGTLTSEQIRERNRHFRERY